MKKIDMQKRIADLEVVVSNYKSSTNELAQHLRAKEEEVRSLEGIIIDLRTTLANYTSALASHLDAVEPDPNEGTETEDEKWDRRQEEYDALTEKAAPDLDHVPLHDEYVHMSHMGAEILVVKRTYKHSDVNILIEAASFRELNPECIGDDAIALGRHGATALAHTILDLLDD